MILGHRWLASLTAVFSLVIVTEDLVGQQGGGAPTAAEEAQLRQVIERLIAVAEPPSELVPYWPPIYEVEADESINAYAHCIPDRTNRAYRVAIHTGILRQVIRQDRDLLAFVVGHELAHILLNHTLCERRERQSEVVDLALNRAREQSADSLGMELAIRAGYSFNRATRGIQRMADVSGGASFERLVATHPSWFDRGAFISAMESDQLLSSLYRGMNAFSNGNYFLLVEQYDAAARAFRRVTAEFRDAHEAWANLGFALLMQYADGLDAADLRRFGVGHLVIPGFYQRPTSLEEQLRGIDSGLWSEAVSALDTALRLEPNLTLAWAHLGMAYLIHPSGTRDVERATRYLRRAAELAAGDTTISSYDRVAIGINVGVAEFAAGGSAEAAFAEAARALEAGTAQRGQASPYRAALDYNRSLLLEASGAATGRRQALELLERYLSTTSHASAWWELGYERYTRLSQTLELRPRPVNELSRYREAELRPVLGIEARPGVEVMLSSPVREVMNRLGKATPVPAVSGTNLVRLHYPSAGMTLLAGDEVLAIVLSGPSAPGVPVRPRGLGSGIERLGIGSTESDLYRVAGEFYDMKRLTVDSGYYWYYRDLGVGFRLEEGRVVEIVVAQIPNRTI